MVSTEINQYIEQLLSGTPSQRYQAEQHLKRSASLEEIEGRLVQQLDKIESVDTKVAILSVLEKRVSKGTTAVIIRHLGHRNHRVRRAAASTLLHASPRLKPFKGQLRSLLEREKDQPTRQFLTKLLER